MFQSYYSYEPETWGYFSSPDIAAAQLQLDYNLKQVPENGLVVDLGAGTGLSLAASINVRRPDIKVINIDPGYKLIGRGMVDVEADVQQVIGDLGQRGEALNADQNWRRNRVAAYCEELPLASEIADMTISYAAVPEYASHGAALQEMVRVLKFGGVALNGPIAGWSIKSWMDCIAAYSKQHRSIDFGQRSEMMTLTDGDQAEVHFTSIVK